MVPSAQAKDKIPGMSLIAICYVCRSSRLDPCHEAMHPTCFATGDRANALLASPARKLRAILLAGAARIRAVRPFSHGYHFAR